MAVVVAQATGNFSAGATWVGGVKPAPGDIAETANFVVTIDEDFTGTLRPTGSGYFIVATGGITITGDVVMQSSYTGGGLRCTHGSGTVALTGTATGGAGNYAYGAYNNSTGTLICDLAIGSNWGPGGTGNLNSGVYGTGAVGQTTKVKRVQSGAYGAHGIWGFVLIEPDATNSAQFRLTPGGSTLTLVDAAAAADFPAATDVRSGVVFDGGDKVGTCAVPVAANVSYGVPVDATVGTAVLSAAAVTAGVWDAARSGHAGAGTFGATSEWAGSVDEAAIATAAAAAILAAADSDPISANVTYSAGVAVSGRLAEVTDLPSEPLDATATQAAAAAALTAYDPPTNAEMEARTLVAASYATAAALDAVDNYVDTEIAAIKAKTDNLPSDPADQSAVEAAITAATSALATAANLATLAGYVDTEVAAILAAVDTEVAAIKAKTDNLPASPAAVGSAMTLTAAYDAAKTAATQTSVDDLPTNAELAAALAAADDAVLAAIADVPTVAEFEARTLPAADYTVVSDLPSVPSAASIADAVWDEAIAGHAGTGSTGAALAAAGAAGDPWATELPGAYGAGTAGALLSGIDSNVDENAIAAAVLAAADSDPISANVTLWKGEDAGSQPLKPAVPGRTLNVDENGKTLMGNGAHGGSSATLTLKNVVVRTNEVGGSAVEIASVATGGTGLKITSSAWKGMEVAGSVADIEADIAGSVNSVAEGVSLATEAINVNTFDISALQAIADAMGLAPTGAPAAGSLLASVAGIEEDTGVTLPAAVDALPAAVDAKLSGVHGAGAWGSAVGSGTGLYTDTVTDGTNPLDGVRVQLYTAPNRVGLAYEAYTNALGVFEMWPDPGVYYRWLDLAGYNFSQDVAVTVTEP